MYMTYIHKVVWTNNVYIRWKICNELKLFKLGPVLVYSIYLRHTYIKLWKTCYQTT